RASFRARGTRWPGDESPRFTNARAAHRGREPGKPNDLSRTRRGFCPAGTLAQQPRLVLLDEPTLHLDIGAQVELLERLRRLAEENRYAVVVVTHELALVAEFADQVVLLQHGRCLRVGTPAAVYQRELLEQVFEAPLDVELGPAGRPRVNLRARRGEDIT